jgi:ribosome-associated translation inhibitor RaiA
MTSRVQITFRRSTPNDSAREVAMQKFEKLATQLPVTARCHVVLDRPIASHAKGSPFLARVEIQGAGAQIATEARNLDPCVAIREAFERAQAQARHARGQQEHARRHGSLAMARMPERARRRELALSAG